MGRWREKPLDLSKAADGQSRISIENLRGKVAITGWDQDQVKISGELDDEAERLIFEKDGDEITIKVVMPRNLRSHHGDGSDLEIRVPRRSELQFAGVSTDVTLQSLERGTEVETVSGRIKARELDKYISLHSVSGNIDSTALEGKIHLSTVSGSIRDRDSSGRIRYRSVSGDIEAWSTPAEVSASVVSGDMALQLGEVEEGEFKSVNGDLEVKLSLAAQARIKATTVNGGARLELPDNTDARFKLSTSAGGRIVNGLTDDKPVKAKYGPSSKLSFETGAGKASVKVTTVNGRVEIREQ